MKINIAIDGPSASGKSTVAKQLCSILNYVHLDTGAMYRCVALEVKRKNIDIEDVDSIVEISELDSSFCSICCGYACGCSCGCISCGYAYGYTCGCSCSGCSVSIN